MNYALALNREVKLSPHVGRNIDTSLTSIDVALSPNFGIVSKEITHVEKDIESRLKRNGNRKLLNRIKRPPTYGWRLDDNEFDKLNKLKSLCWKDVVTLWV